MTPASLLVLLVGLLIAFAYAQGTGNTRKVLLTGVGLLILLGLVHRYRHLLPPFVVPLILAYLLDPLLDALERRGFSRVRAIIVVYAGLLALLLAAMVLIIPPLSRQVQAVVASTSEGIDLNSLPSSLTKQDKLIKGIAKTALALRIPPATVRELETNLELYRLDQHLSKAASWVAEQLNTLLKWLASQVSGLLWVILLPITLFYCLRDYDPLRRRLYYLIPADRREEVTAVTAGINRVLGGYLRGYAILSLALATIQTTALLILASRFEFRYALFLGLLAGATYFIPFVGSLVSTILTAFVIYFTGGHSVVEALISWAVLQGINSLFDNVIQPRVIGEQVGLHPLVVMLAILIGGAEFGLLGILFAAPTAASIKILIQHFWPRLSEPIPDDQTPEAAARRQAEAAAAEAAGPAAPLPPADPPDAAAVDRKDEPHDG